VALRSALIGLAVAGYVAACDVGHAVVADNRTDGELLARIWVDPIDVDAEPFSYVVIVPRTTRFVIAEQPFKSDVEVERVDILAPDCTELARFDDMSKGSLFVIDNGPSIEQHDEFPSGRSTATRIELCPGDIPDPP